MQKGWNSVTLGTFRSAARPDRVTEEKGSSPVRRAGNLIVVMALFAGAFTWTQLAQAQERAERKVINRIAPVYPELAKRMHVSGVVKLEVVIRANGTVKSTKVVGGNPVLIGSATDAVGKWKFEAAPDETTEVVQLSFDPR
jgi:TonB family protein